MFSPRVALILKPAPDHAVRVSYNKAFRSPSLINNYLDTTIVNQLEPRRDQPGVRTAWSTTSRCARSATRTCIEESIESFEIGYTGIIKNRATRVGGGLLDQERGRDLLHADRPLSRAPPPPPGWPLPAGLVLEVLPPPCASPPRRARPAACRRSSATAISARSRTRASSSASTAPSTRR